MDKKNYKKFNSLIRNIPDHPKKGIIFRDITPLLEDIEAFDSCVTSLVEKTASINFNKIACIDARGFIVGVAFSLKTRKNFFLLRKKGKLPYKKFSVKYDLEYSSEEMEMHRDSVKPGDKILIVDDLLATGGTTLAAVDLINKAGGEAISLAVFIDLPELSGREKIEALGLNVFSLFSFEGK